MPTRLALLIRKEIAMQLLLRQRKSLWGFVASAFCAVFFSADTAIAQTYNQIRFVIGTGGADLRGDCQATATLKATNGSTLKTITLYSGSGSGWPNNSTNTVTANLSPALSRSQIASIEITQIEHNGFTETESMQGLAEMLSKELRGPVVDETGIKGEYDLVLTWGLDAGLGAASEETTAESVAIALQRETGLILKKQKAVVDFLVVDHVEKVPTEN
jgi:hypothetical protein